MGLNVTNYVLQMKGDKSIASGFDHATRTGDNTFSIYFIDGSKVDLTIPLPSDGQDGISITGVNDLGNGKFTLLLSDGSETDPIQTVKGQKGDKGDKLTFNDLTDEEKASLKGADGYTPVKGTDYFDGQDGFSPIIEENENNTDKIYKLDVTTANGTFTTPNLKGADGQGGTGGSGENKIDSISVNGSPISIDENKNVDITVPSIDGLAKTEDIPTKVSELTNDSGYLTEHQDISGKVDKVEGKSLISDTEIARLASVDNYDDTDIKAEIAKKANATAIPSKVSELTNDSNYQTAEQVNSTVTTEIAKVVADAPEDLNTLKEMSDWIAGHENDASAMNSAISDNKTAITALQTGKANKTEIPTELPANGGNASTVNGHTVNSDVPENAVFTDTTYSDATQIEHGLMSVDDKKKLDGLKKYTPDGTTITADEDGTLHGVAKVTVDDALSSTSTNPVQNKVVKAYVDKKASENVDFSTSTSKLLNDTVEAPLVLSNATRNLLNPTLLSIAENDLKDSGITAKINSDGSITLNGTATRSIWSVLYTTYGSGKNNMFEGLRVFSNLNYNESGVYGELYIAYCRDNDGRQETWRSGHDGDLIPDGNGEPCLVRLHITSGATFNNETFFIMLTDDDAGAVNDKLIPYSGYDIKTCGKNLLNLTKITTNNTGVTASLSNGIITLDGTVDTSGGWQDLYFNTDEQYISLKRGVKYTISTKDKVQKVFLMLRRHNGLEIVYSHDCSTNGTTFVASKDMLCQVTVTFKESSTFNNKQIAPQIEVGENVTEYQHYQDGGTAHIDSTTKFPLLGLKSFDGETNIISSGNVEVTYAKSDSGKAILDMSENKLDKDNVVNNQTTTEEGHALDARQANPNVEGSLGAQIKAVKKETTVNLLKLTLQTTTQNGLTCTNNGDGTYTLSGTATDQTTFIFANADATLATFKGHSSLKLVGFPKKYASAGVLQVWRQSDNLIMRDRGDGVIITGSNMPYGNCNMAFVIYKGGVTDGMIIKPMLTTDLEATYDDFVPYTGDGETLASDVADIKNDLGGLTFSASGTTLTITDGTNTWTLGANS